jgi:hypothetical protein
VKDADRNFGGVTTMWKTEKIKGKHCSPQESGSDTMLRFVNLKYENKSGSKREKIETNNYGWFGVRHLRPSL